MQNLGGQPAEPETETKISLQTSEINDWTNYRDDEVMQQHSAIQAEEAGKIPFVGDKEPLSSLADEYKSGNPILLEKIKVLTEQYAAIRRTRGDGNCFFRSFMFAYLDHILESQDSAEIDRITVNVEQCRKTLISLGYAEFNFEDFFAYTIHMYRQSSANSNEHSLILGGSVSVNHHNFIPVVVTDANSDGFVGLKPFITLLYRPGHYDILYPK
ncbi:ubiquitinyl hydrolase 1 [Salvia divinorum]|uniref:Ubiquitinyl hydrolase 1 n=1 Tax=Salvia divinorum TaxID=28513 RepID=A0ABD1H2P1_SALDI